MAKKPRTKSKAESSHVGTYFTSLTVENIRSFSKAQTLDLTRNGRSAKWTVILGDNNLGKSTLLEVLKVGASGVNDDLVAPVRAGNRQKYPSFPPLRPWLRHSATRCTARFVLEQSDLSTAGPSRVKWSYESESVDVRIHGSGKGQRYDHTRRSLELTAQLGEWNLLAFFGAGTEAGQTADSLKKATEWLLQADYKAKLDTSSPFEIYRDQVFQTLVHLLPEVREFRIDQPERPGTGWPTVSALMPDGLWVPLNCLGSGYQAQIAWMVDFAAKLFERYPDSPDPLAEPAICLIDEIDLHLHPKWQRQIIGHLSERFPRTQFIVTAHSPLIVQAAEDANLVLLRREGTEVVIDNDPERLQGWRVDQILASELFGLESVRPPSVQKIDEEHTKLLAKASLTAKDSARLAEIEAKLLSLPDGESKSDQQVRSLVEAMIASKAKRKSGA